MKKQKDNYLFGWIPDLPDARDLMYSTTLSMLRSSVTKVDLRKQCPPVYDQKSIGSCVANSLSGLFQFDQIKQKVANWIPSRLFLYYNARALINTTQQDSGAYIRDGVKTMSKEGMCAETNWAYDISKFTQRPPKVCYDKATTNKITSYMRIDNTNIAQLKGCLNDGYPFVFGFTVYDSFMSIGKNGIMPMPNPSESVKGGHAVMCVGFDDSKQVFIVRNSWGKGWGDKGYFYMPYAYMTDANRCDDFWTIRTVESGLKFRRLF